MDTILQTESHAHRLERSAVAFALALHDVGVGPPRDHVVQVGVLEPQRRHGPQRQFDALALGQQPERRHHGHVGRHPETIPVGPRVTSVEEFVGCAVRNDDDVVQTGQALPDQKVPGRFGHHGRHCRPRRQRGHDDCLGVGELRQHRVHRDDQRHGEPLGERQHERSGVASEDAELVLDDDDVHIEAVDRVCDRTVRVGIVASDRERS